MRAGRQAGRRALATVTMALLLVFASAGVGCSGVPAGETVRAEAVRAVVAAYNEALIRAFAAMDMNELNTTATEDQAAKEFYLMAALGEGRLRMLSTLVGIEFGEVAFPEEGKATVTTIETWDYDHVSLDTSETVRSERGVVYRLRYDLVLQDGRWFVDGVTSLDDPPASEETTP